MTTSDDLIKRLRGPVGAGMTGESALAMAEAADTIAALSAEVQWLRAHIPVRGEMEDNEMYARRLLRISEQASRRVP